MNSPAEPAAPLPGAMNVGLRLSEMAQRVPEQVAIAVVAEREANGQRRYTSLTFRELDELSTHAAAGLHALGVRPGTRLVLLVRPGIEFFALVFGMFKAGVVTVLIDPGIGRRNLIKCLSDVDPAGFVAIPAAQAVRALLRHKFPHARHNVTVGRRWFWGGTTYEQLLATGRKNAAFVPATSAPDDPAAIIFTSGSTGPPKGVLYSHANFSYQVNEIRDFYGLAPGGIDVPAFPLFALFNAAMGVTTVVPEMDFTRPASVNPENFLAAVRDWKATQSFGSPAVWNAVGRYCEANSVSLPSLTKVFSAGAPVPAHVLRRVQACIGPAGNVFTPYGATEALPVASISAREVLGETAAKSALGAGTCVGRPFPRIEWRVIPISDGPIATLDAVPHVAPGEIGELIVRGPVVTREYVTRREANALHKIADGESFWHRLGDVGYLDEHDRFWFCGRKSHRVITPKGTLFTIPCEAIFNQHPSVYRSALVGVGPSGEQRPIMLVECWPEKRPKSSREELALVAALKELGTHSPLTSTIEHLLLHPAFPVDIRHNAKIFREKLAVWAGRRLG